MRWTKKKVAAAIALLVLAGAAWFFHSEGEAVKGHFVYCCEGPGVPDNPPGYGMGTTAILSLLIIRAQDKDYAIPTVCKTDFTECARQLAWDKDVERACTHAVDAMKVATQKIKAEPSMLLGFNKVLAEWQTMPICSPLNSNAGASDSIVDCYFNSGVEFYELPEGLRALSTCWNTIEAHPYAPAASTS